MDDLLDFLGSIPSSSSTPQTTSISSKPPEDRLVSFLSASGDSSSADTQITSLEDRKTSKQGFQPLDLLKIKEEELRIKRERLKLKDQELALDLELAEARRKVIEGELGTSNTPSKPPECKSPSPILVPEYVAMDSPLKKEDNITSSLETLPSVAPVNNGSNCSKPQGLVPTAELTQAFQAFADGVQQAPLPRREVRKFAGDPLDFHRFVTDFEDNICHRVKDPMTKLTYLIGHCVGSAYESIQTTIIIRPPSKAYDTAMKILTEQFGQEYKVVAAHMKLLKEGARLREGDTDSLYKLATQMRNCYITLTEWGFQANLNNYDTIDKIFLRLPNSLQREFQKRSALLYSTGKEPDFKELMEFIQHHAMLSNTRFGQMISRKAGPPGPFGINVKEKSHSTQVSREVQNCGACNEHHFLWRCPKFKDMAINERKILVQRLGLCYNCLNGKHLARRCSSRARCRQNGCGGAHHTLLHVITPKSNETHPGTTGGTTAVSFLTTTSPAKVWLKVVPVEVWSNDQKRSVKTYAFLDEGSTSTLCTQDLVKRLGARGMEQMVSISTVNGEQRKRVLQLDLNVKGIGENKVLSFKGALAVRSLPQLTGDIPSCEETTRFGYLDDLEFPQLDKRQVDLLIGADNLEAHEIQDERRGSDTQPRAVYTTLGWALVGKDDGLPGSHSTFFTYVNRIVVDNNLEGLFSCDLCDGEVEEEYGPSMEDRRAMNVMENHTKTDDGRYVISLPWKDDSVSLPDNRQVAVKRLDYLKHKFLRDEDYFAKYKEKINEYLSKGYARVVPKDYTPCYPQRDWYLPHHSTGNKFRVVFDCAAKCKGTSLNDNLLSGPDYTNNLAGVLVRFRQDYVAFTCDIKAMFHQVLVDCNDYNSLKFLWWPGNDLTEEPVDHQMLVHIFGARSSPSCAAYALRQTAIENVTKADDFTVNTILRNFYVDDCLCSTGTSDEALVLIEQLRNLLASSGFHLSKFRSSCCRVFSSVPGCDRINNNGLYDITCNGQTVAKTLGLMWNNQDDMIQVKVNINSRPMTRRGILSVISQVFDPFGMLQPFVFPMKCLLQSLCFLQLSWDDEIPEDKRTAWCTWLDQLPCLQTVSIPRCLKPNNLSVKEVQLHIFCDASELGFGAVGYLRMVSKMNSVHCSFVMSKSRVAPQRKRTIPRLELSAAVLGVQLSKFLQREMDLTVNAVYYWSDSTAVLQFINNSKRRFNTFVANRLLKIHNGSTPDQWHYVNTGDNPADLLSRGEMPEAHDHHPTWFSGPDFLWKSMENWPTSPLIPFLSEGNIELKKTVNSIQTNKSVSKTEEKLILSELCKRYSNWFKLQKAVAWILKLRELLKHKYLLRTPLPPSFAVGGLTVKNIEDATMEIVKHVQAQSFSDAIQELNTQEYITVTKSKVRRMPSIQSLQRLNPFLKDGILRVGGRIQRSALPFHVKHPVILPSNHHITELIAMHYHEQEGHCGTIHTLATIRQFYWILRGQSTVRSVLNRCIRCRSQRAKPAEQIMGPLPACRLTPGHAPFHYTGIDYMGPFFVKCGRSTPKRYICVFTCLSMRAVHLEVSHSLDTSSFLQALSRFISRRSKPAEIWSDNGSNFVGANRELRNAVKNLNSSNVQNSMLKFNIDWHFNPPAASHQGGIWERIIRTVRKVLCAITKDRVFNDEAFQSFVVEVEQILNNRPITPLSSDPADDLPLTPKMLLTGHLHSVLPPGQFLKADGYRKSWKLVHFMADQFWSQWIKLYIPCLQYQQKWFKPCRNFAVGDIVLIHDDRCRRGSWPLGIIKDVFPDAEGRVRRVRVETSTSSLTRDIRKLSLLEGSC